MRIFYEDIYQHANDNGQLTEKFQWSDVLKKLIWKNQLTLFSFYNREDVRNDSEIMKKASAWFQVTYQWLNNQTKPTKNSTKRRNPMTDNQQQNPEQQYRYKYQPLFSFAWIVYPVLMKIYDNKPKSSNEK